MFQTEIENVQKTNERLRSATDKLHESKQKVQDALGLCKYNSQNKEAMTRNKLEDCKKAGKLFEDKYRRSSRLCKKQIERANDAKTEKEAKIALCEYNLRHVPLFKCHYLRLRAFSLGPIFSKRAYNTSKLYSMLYEKDRRTKIAC